MFKPFLVISALALIGVSAHFQEAQKPAESAPPPPAAVKPIPPQVKTTPESLAHAKKMYGYDCAMCHGADGAGKGDVAAQMKLTMTDLTDPSVLKAKSDSDLFALIRDGKGQMPAEGDRGKPDDLWSMVAYVRSLSSKTASAAQPH
jgi:mono/diheme cytochrome c family protein